MLNRRQSGRVFVFGDVSRIRGYLYEADILPHLTIGDLWSLKPDDVIISPRPRSTLLEALFLLRTPEQRPKIILIADGVIFQLNSKKRGNRRYGWLFRHVLADILVIAQPQKSIEGFCEDLDAVESIVDLEISSRKLAGGASDIILLGGNDALFDKRRDEVAETFKRAYNDLRERLGADVSILLSIPNKSLAKAVSTACSGLQNIGRIIDADVDPDKCVFVGSPSTVMYDQFLAGRSVCLLPGYSDPWFESFCIDFNLLLEYLDAPDVDKVDVPALERIEDRRKIHLDELMAMVPAKRRPSYPRFAFLRYFQPHVFLNELRILMQNSKRASS